MIPNDSYLLEQDARLALNAELRDTLVALREFSRVLREDSCATRETARRVRAASALLVRPRI